MAKGCSTLEAPNVSDDDDYSSEEELQTMVFILGQDCSELDSAIMCSVANSMALCRLDAMEMSDLYRSACVNRTLEMVFHGDLQLLETTALELKCVIEGLVAD